MSKLVWDDVADRTIHSGVDRGVFYPKNGSGVVWTGLTAVEQSESYFETDMYEDGRKRHISNRSSSYAATIKAYTYPEELESKTGLSALNQQAKRFNFSFRTFENDEELIHLVYNAIAKPIDVSYSTGNQEVSDFGWEISTTPSKTNRSAPSAHFVIRPVELRFDVHMLLLDTIYGGDTKPATLPPITKLVEMLEEPVMLRIIDHGDGTWTAIGPDEAIKMLDDTTFEINWPSAVYLSEDLYELSDL